MNSSSATVGNPPPSDSHAMRCNSQRSGKGMAGSWGACGRGVVSAPFGSG